MNKQRIGNCRQTQWVSKNAKRYRLKYDNDTLHKEWTKVK